MRHMRRKNQRELCRCVTADSHETRVPQAELPGVAIDEIQAHRKGDVDADINRDAEGVTIEMRRETGNREGGDNRQQQPSFRPGKHQTFSTCALPSSPAGLNSRIKINIANAMPSR